MKRGGAHMAERERRVPRVQENGGHPQQGCASFGRRVLPAGRGAEDAASQSAPTAGPDALRDLVPGHAGTTGEGVVEDHR
jgi:hypothetical protein